MGKTYQKHASAGPRRTFKDTTSRRTVLVGIGTPPLRKSSGFGVSDYFGPASISISRILAGSAGTTTVRVVSFPIQVTEMV